jgi:hypothetical protein
MTDLHDYDQKLVISDFINNAINTLSDAISFLAGQLLTIGSARVVRQSVEAFKNAGDILLRNASKVFGD